MMVWSFTLRSIVILLLLGLPSSLLADDSAGNSEPPKASSALQEPTEQETQPDSVAPPSPPAKETYTTAEEPTPPATPAEPRLNDVPTDYTEPDDGFLVEWFGLMIGGGHPYVMIRLAFFKLVSEHVYWTILDTALAYDVGDFGAGMAWGWRKKLPDKHEIRVGLGLRYGYWYIHSTPWSESANKTYPCIPKNSIDTIRGIVLEPQFVFLKRYKHVLLGVHLGLPIMVGGTIDQDRPHFKTEQDQWSPGLQTGMYTSFY